MSVILSGTIDSAKSISDIVANIVTASAVIVGAVWAYWRFVRERNRWPRATMELVISHLPISPEKFAVNVKVKVHNAGSGLMRLERLRVDLYRVLPATERVKREIDNDEIVPEGAVGAKWPPIDQRKQAWTHDAPELEPSENDEFSCDFFIPSTDEVIFIYAYLKNVTKKQANHELGWTVTSFYGLTESTGQKSADNLVAQEAT